MNTEDGLEREFYACRIHNASLVNSTHSLTTIISGNNASKPVEMVIYDQKRQVTFIPNSLITDFEDMKYLWVEPKNKFKNVRLHHINGENFTTFVVEGNEIRKLGPHCFVWAKSLEIINLRHNKIEMIHRLSFSDLTKLKRLYLHGNMIKNILENTLSNLKSLVVLDLRHNACMNKTITIKDHENIDLEIQDHCAYEEAIHTLIDFTKSLDDKFESEILFLMNNVTEMKEILQKNSDTDLKQQIDLLTQEMAKLKGEQKGSSHQDKTNMIFYGLFAIVIFFLLCILYAFVYTMKKKMCLGKIKYESTQTMNTISI